MGNLVEDRHAVQRSNQDKQRMPASQSSITIPPDAMARLTMLSQVIEKSLDQCRETRVEHHRRLIK